MIFIETMEKRGYYHVCTDGNALSWMFQDKDDFIAGVKRIGICLVKVKLLLVSFILMDNHVHFILYGTIFECKAFINLYKRLTGTWIRNKYGINDYLRLLPSEIIRIRDEENLLNTIAYIDRNAVNGGYQFMTNEYPWGSGRYVFRDSKYSEEKNLIRIGDMDAIRQRSLLKTRIRLPKEWLMNSDGMIIPCSFMDINRIERIFKTPVRYLYYLSKKLEGQIEIDMVQAKKTFIPDKEMRPVVKRLGMELFDCDDIRTLDVKSRLEIAKRLRYEYATTVKQISRMVYLDHELLRKFI